MLQTTFDNYSLAGDVAVLAICAVIFILLITSFVSRTRSFRIFQNIVFLLALAAAFNISYHIVLSRGDPSLNILVYILRIAYQAFLLDLLFLFTLYTTEISGMRHRDARITAIVATSLMMVIIAIDVIMTAAGSGFRLADDGTVAGKTNVYVIGYLLFVVLIAILMSQVRKLVYKRVLYGFYGVMAVAVITRFVQMATNRASLTTMTFMFPAIAMLYVIHSNPYNVSLGTVDNRAMEDMVRSMHESKESFVFLSMLLTEFDEEGKELPREVRALVRKFSVKYFRNSVLFQFSRGHIVLVAPKRKNKDYEEKIEKILEGFHEQYGILHYMYKIVIGESIEEISRKNEYVKLIHSVERNMAENTVCRVGDEELAAYRRDEYILHELTDIYKKADVDDPRVLAFCQPVFNLRTGQFDTAEALMRLELKETGILPPTQFIPLAESHGFIHVLTEIILNKTCREIKRLTEEGFRITRISVNVSVLELKEDCFCDDINRIIVDNHIQGEKVALELTESGNEADFMIMKKKIEELHREGIKFYLDDFGIGYSNMQRILELPFDIIKFDRSLVLASEVDEHSEKIVESLAHMFREMDYSILYEGVESSVEEQLCRGMSASYLQGYMYARPVPIEQLRDFLQKVS